jgi:hypothetical protein
MWWRGQKRASVLRSFSCLSLLILSCVGMLALSGGGPQVAVASEIASSVQNSHLTRSLFVVVIDGLRQSEAFDDPTHAYIPRMWDDLRPQGAILRNFYNRAETITAPAAHVIANGVWGFADNDPSARPQLPTIFEYYRRANPSVPKEKIWFITGNFLNQGTGYSLHPLYGETYSATTLAYGQVGDRLAWQALQGVMAAYHPDLVCFWLDQVDAAGHSGDWGSYAASIEQADGIVGALWDKIQSDPYYRDRTTILVTTDHGREDDERGSWTDHGGISESNKRLMLLALGPDIIPGAEIQTVHEQIDVAPTVGALMGFATPLAEGHVLTEMLRPSMLAVPQAPAKELAQPDGAQRLTFDPGRSEHPAIAANDEGLHVVWVDDRSGAREIFYIRRPVGGSTWTPPEVLSESGVEARAPAITADALTVHVVWLDYREGNWSLYYRRRTASGGWTPVRCVVTSRVETHDTWPAMPWEPGLAISNGLVVGVIPGYFDWIASIAQTQENPTGSVALISGLEQTNNGHGVSVAARGTDVYATWIQVVDGHWVVFLARSSDGGQTWSRPWRVSRTGGNAIRPALIATESGLHLVWADDAVGQFRILYTRSSSRGLIWTQPVPLTSGPGWNPALTAADGRLAVAWEDYQTGDAEILFRRSLDGRGNAWSESVHLSRASGFSLYPALAVFDGRIYAVWQDDRDGNFEIYMAQVP